MSIEGPDQPEPRCSSCGYDLRGFDAAMNCPECGKPVAVTLAGDPLAASDAAWRRSLWQGAVVLIPVAALRALLLALWTYQAARFGNTIVWPSGLTPQAQEIVEISADLLGTLAIWLITSPDTLCTPRVLGFGLTSVIRLIVAARFVSTILFHIAGDIIARRYQVDWAVGDRAMSMTEYFLLFMLLEQLSARVPAPALASWFITFRWSFLSAQALGLVLEIIPNAFDLFNPIVRARVTIAGYLPQLALDVWLILMLARLARAVLRVEQAAPAVSVG